MQSSTFSYIISQMPLNMVTERYRTFELSTARVFRTVRLFLANLALVSIPRLELAAAVVPVKLNCQIRNELEYPIYDVIYWTDSIVVLQYIRNESRRFHTFVANRIAMIHDESTPRQWRHVDTCVNPAGIASRGAKGSELHTLELWLHGPKFLW